MNPPLRTEETIMARQAVADSIIDVMVPTTHRTRQRPRECEWACAANGMTGLEQALSSR